MANTTLNITNLYYVGGGSDKVYNTWMEDMGNSNYRVGFSYGRRGSTLTTGYKTTAPVDYSTALKVQNKLIAEKQNKGYLVGTVSTSGIPAAAKFQATKTRNNIGDTAWINLELLVPVDAAEVEELMEDDKYILQEKKDGERRAVILNDSSCADTVMGLNRKSKYVALPADLHAELAAAYPTMQLELDGELIGDVLHVFDVLYTEVGEGCAPTSPLKERLEILNSMFSNTKLKFVKLVRTAVGFAAKHKLYEKLVAENAEGVVFKHLDLPYTEGRGSAKQGPYKYKFYETASFIVHKVNQQRSVELKLLGNVVDVLVGNVTIPVNFQVPPAGAVVEVRYLYAYKGGSIYQPVYLGERTDIAPEECLISQLKYKQQPITLI